MMYEEDLQAAVLVGMYVSVCCPYRLFSGKTEENILARQRLFKSAHKMCSMHCVHCGCVSLVLIYLLYS